MKYTEYAVNQNGLEKKLGLLGETHLYTLEESAFVKKIIPDYDIVAYEGSGKKSLFFTLIPLLYRPLFAIYSSGEGRSFENPNGYRIAKKEKKEIVRLEKDEYEAMIPKQKLAVLTMGIISLISCPFIWIGKQRGYDINGQKPQDKKSRVSNLVNLAFKGNIADRDYEMSDNIVKTLERKDCSNLLAIFGLAHLEGITKNLKDILDMEEVRTSSPDIKK